MKTTRRWLWLLAGFALALSFASAPARAGFAFSLDPEAGVSPLNLQVGQTFNLDVDVTGVDSGQSISYLKLTEDLGGTLFQLMGIAAGNAIPAGGGFSFNGSLRTFEIDYNGSEPITAPGTLAVVTLTALGIGSGEATLTSPTTIGPSTADPINFAGMNLNWSILAAATGSSAVPEPSSLALTLISSAVGGLAWRRSARSVA